MNVVPRTGGNDISGAVSSVPPARTQSDNFTQELKDAGLAAPTPFSKVADLNGSFGGPIKRIAWYFVNARTQGSTTTVASMYHNQNAGDARGWTYVPDVSRPAYSDRTWENVSGRLTWQATSRNKIGVFWDHQWICRKCTGMTQGLHGSAPSHARSDRRSVARAAARRDRSPGRRPDEPAAAGRRLRRHVNSKGQPRTDSEPDTQSHSRRRAMRERLRRERRYSWLELSLAGLGRNSRLATHGAHPPPTSPARTA